MTVHKEMDSKNMQQSFTVFSLNMLKSLVHQKYSELYHYSSLFTSSSVLIAVTLKEQTLYIFQAQELEIQVALILKHLKYFFCNHRF